MKFETLEAAQAAYNQLKTEFDNQSVSLQNALNDKEIAETTALEAIQKANTSPEESKKTTVKIGTDKYEIVFGVDGLTKEELAKDSKKLATMVKKGSAALIKMEDK